MKHDISALTLQPVSGDERIPALDVLRGFALFGVLSAYTLWSLGSPPRESYSLINSVLDTVLGALIDAKFYTLFAFLFGIGFAMQLQRAEIRGLNIVRFFGRRLVGLAMIGVVHALLLRNGDILVPYAVMGIFLLIFRRASNKTLMIAGVVAVLHPLIVGYAWNFSGIPLPEPPQTNNASYLADNFAWVRFWYLTAVVYWPGCLPMFFFGLYMGRRRFFEQLKSKLRTLRFALVIGVVVSALVYAFRMYLQTKLGPNPFSPVLWQIHSWGLATSYASTLLLPLQTQRGERLLTPLGVMGRMALTNYLLQSVMVVPICISLGLFDRVTPVIALTLTVIVWSIQDPVSIWWLNRFRFGPAEWLWRSITYCRLQPMEADGDVRGSRRQKLIPTQ